MKQKKKISNSSATATQVNDNAILSFVEKYGFWLLAFWAMLPYFNSIGNGYALDDDFTIYKNSFVQQGVLGIPDILSHPYMNIEDRTADYRPLSAITFAIEQTVFGGNAHISHFINLLLYALLCSLCFLLLKQIFGASQLALLSAFYVAALFAWHPAHTEVVNSLKNREELLSVLLGFVSFYFSLKYFNNNDKIIYAVLSVLVLLIACTAKLSALPFAIIIPMWLFFKQKEGFKKTRNLLFCGAIFVLPVIYLAAVAGKSEFIILDLENPWDYVGLQQKLGLSMLSLGFYFKFLLFPFPFSFYYGYNVIAAESIFASLPILSLMLHVALFITAVILYLKRNVFGFLLLAYFASLAMYANLVAPYAGIVSERALFLASFFGIAIIAYSATKFYIKEEKNSFAVSKFFVVCTVLLFGIYAYLIVNRNKDWKNAKKLMLADITHLENSALANFLLANELKREAETTSNATLKYESLQLSKFYYKQSLKTGPRYSVPMYRLGMIYQYGENKFDSAFITFKKAYSNNQNFAPITFELARCYSMKGSFDTAKILLTPMYEKQKLDTSYLYFLARAYFKTGEIQKGFEINENLIQLNSNSPFPYLNQGWFFDLSGKPKEALENYKKAYDLGNREPYIIAYIEKSNTKN